ncbi:hypothetical protein XM38_018120 [Halomicronema hongdechloris C2206]|uniref:DUF4332 domain-containing protein n=1 Tax=Halomicronema hongdechloris C2206 TaxID=1641165 RepID=A0A1Z3HKP9_9CYAN|nr:DUF4332 domain-containing protein [Halomicronema hongdechloris]ASC70865.1 hypothetical protein XM38_018120 [Halomicronema hongdechloris C2206]
MRPSNWNLTELPGLSPEHCHQLAQVGIHTTLDLFSYGQAKSTRQQLATTLRLTPRYVNKWIALADLARLPSVGCQYNGLLLHAGIASVAQLARTSLSRLHPLVKRLQVATLRRSDLCPGPAEMAVWIREARLLLASQDTKTSP